MRVTNNSVTGADLKAQTAQTKKTDKASSSAADAAKTAKPATVIEGDSRPEISSKARELSEAKAAATSAPDVREAKIAALKERIAAGKYNVDPKAVADRMVDEHLSSNIG
jgi:negative regulator of flagellin synthesis FlgM